VLVGSNTADDAAVYQFGEMALIQTIDYFTPVVDDAYDFGRIAAANALSDVYAMGGRPIMALNIVGFPAKTLGMDILAEILRGGSSVAEEAGIPIVGGHTIDDKEPKYGLAVTGVVEPGGVMTNATALPGDHLILTKPLGVGIITTGIKGQAVSDETIARVVHLMTSLNKEAADAMQQVGANACTDVTGFGLLGHLHEMCEASGVGARLRLSSVPVMAEAWELVANRIVPGGTRANLSFLENSVDFEDGISEDQQLVLADAQTSGGLLIAVAPQKADTLVEALKEAGTLAAADIGEIVADARRKIAVVK